MDDLATWVLEKLPDAAARIGAVFQSGWASAGMCFAFAVYFYQGKARAERALLSEKDARIVENKEVGKLADNMREVMVLLGRKVEPPTGHP